MTHSSRRKTWPPAPSTCGSSSTSTAATSPTLLRPTTPDPRMSKRRRTFRTSRRRATTSKPFSTRSGSNELTRRVARRPGPLEIEAAEPAGHVHHLTDKEQAGRLLRFHRLGRKFGRIDSADRDFRLLITLGSGGAYAPAVKQLVERVDFAIREHRGRLGGAESVGKPLRQM